MEIEQKKCDRCRQLKDISEFGTTNGRINKYCTECGDKRKIFYNSNRDRIVKNISKSLKKYYEKNIEYRDNHIEEILSQAEYAFYNDKKEYQRLNQKYRLTELPQIIELKKQNQKYPGMTDFEKRKAYYDNNREKINTRLRNKKKVNSLFKLSGNVRTLIVNSLKNKNVRKNSKTEQILGCSYKDFKKYLEEQFEPWMNWDNYGNWNGVPTEPNQSWEIDHVIPLCSARTEEDVLKLNHYTNLKPMCGYTNRFIKSGNYVKEETN